MKWAIVSGLVTIFIFAVFLGCSEDNKVAASNPKAVGDTLDPVYQAAASAFDHAFEEAIGAVLDELDLVNTVLNYPHAKLQYIWSFVAEEAARDTVYFDTSNQFWYHFYDHGPAYDSLSFRDSLQFMHGDTVVQWPIPSLLTGVSGGEKFIILRQKIDQNGFDTTIYMSVHMDISAAPGQIAAGGEITINGDGTIMAYSNQVPVPGNCSWSYLSLHYHAASIKIDISNTLDARCWESGWLSMSGPMTISCLEDSVYVQFNNWQFKSTVQGVNLMSIVIDDEVSRWRTNRSCD